MAVAAAGRGSAQVLSRIYTEEEIVDSSLVVIRRRRYIVEKRTIGRSAPTTINSLVRTREYLTGREVERLMAAAKKGSRWAHRDATMRDTGAEAARAGAGAIFARLYDGAGRADDAQGVSRSVRPNRHAGQDAIRGPSAYAPPWLRLCPS